MKESFGNGSNRRPILKIPHSNLERILEVIAIASMIIQIAMLTAYWSRIPQRIVTHIGIDGRPDRWGGRVELFVLPIISVVLYVLFTTLSKFPHIFNYIVDINEENARYQYENARTLMIAIKSEMLIFFTIFQYNYLMDALNRKSYFGQWVLPIFIITIFGTLVYFIRKSIKNK
ncbi:DUF1648 domain-containing protein [Clostridium sp. C8-1-8]|uniref:DUF1648 domain-containing protein n=1 Tax=Clostridium sp. C8-1-8 TaxID=2698831 RepID=UPI00136CDE9C|nr:DUF1648 domain-containing protein [Clostridium sp. C8-1-8]